MMHLYKFRGFFRKKREGGQKKNHLTAKPLSGSKHGITFVVVET
jgi:CRISPR/Cas system Type II protein with McrA/HNH and RuvC-like nuclease domain